jgi:hypothetical protein
MASIANIDGFYYVPRIDKKIVESTKRYYGAETYMEKFR